MKKKEERTKGRAAESKEVHESLKGRVCLLGRLLGHDPQVEHGIGERSRVRLDVIWHPASNPSVITHAFEVQHRGDPKSALSNLEIIRKHHSGCRTFCVVCHKREIKDIQRTLVASKVGFVGVLRSSEIDRWVDVLQKQDKPISMVARYRRQLPKKHTEDDLADLKKRAPKKLAPLIDAVHQMMKAGLL